MSKEQNAILMLEQILDEFIFTDKGNILSQIVMGEKYQHQGYVTDELKEKLFKAKDVLKGKTITIKKEGRKPIKSVKIKKKKTPKKTQSKKLTPSKTAQTRLETLKIIRKTHKKTITRKELMEIKDKYNFKTVSFIMANKTKNRGEYKIPQLKDVK
jgi:hypothetical protein